jgi:hypothetical protein
MMIRHSQIIIFTYSNWAQAQELRAPIKTDDKDLLKEWNDI